jgi:hypothetical protein
MTWAFLETLKKKPRSLSWLDLLLTMRTKLQHSEFEQIPQLSSGKALDLNLKFLSVI